MVGNKIKELRRVLGFNQKDFAGKVGITPAALSQFEHNKRCPSYQTLKKIIDTFNIDPKALF